MILTKQAIKIIALVFISNKNFTLQNEHVYGTKINLIEIQQEKLDNIKLCKIELIERNKTIYDFQFDYCTNNKKS